MTQLAPGRWLNGQLRLLSWLGEELHGDSFLGELQPQGRTVHVKVLHSEACRTAGYIERFRRAAERALALRHGSHVAIQAFGVLPAQADTTAPRPQSQAPRHPLHTPSSGLTPLRQVPAPQGIPWLACDPVEGPDLRSCLIDGMAPTALATLLLPVADLLDHAARLGLEHGELSPSSLLVVHDAATSAGGPGEPTGPRGVLLDLGLAKVLEDSPLDVPMEPGMLRYRSPEQCASGRCATPACDRYALATILYESVACRTPFLSSDPQELLRAHRFSPVPPLRTVLPSLHRTQALDAFFVRALAKQPEARFSTATAMIEEFITTIGPQEGGDPLPSRRRSSIRHYRLSRHGMADGVMDVVVGPRAALGKQPECDVVCHGMPSPEYDAVTAGISREHAVLIWLDDRLSILDQSSNGTFVNDRRAGPRLMHVPDEALVRMGEHLTLQARYLAGGTGETIGVLLERRDAYAAGVPRTLMVWQRLHLPGSPVARLGGALAQGHLWISQRELFFSGGPALGWQRQDGTPVIGPAPLRNGDTLSDGAGVLTVEH